MATADSALHVISRALFDPNPTTDEKSERYLAMALGYPGSWHVVRRIEEEKASSSLSSSSPAKSSSAPKPEEEGAPPHSSSSPTKHDDKGQGRFIIVDRIYAGSPAEGVDMWFNHIAAQTAAEEWVEGESSAYGKKGGQLLPRKPKFQKGDQVRVNYQGEWCAARIDRRTEKKEGFRYNVHYLKDNSTQKMVNEEEIELLENPYQTADGMGLEGWQAKLQGKKWKFISPDGKNFSSKTAAMKHKKKLDKGGKAAKKEEPAPQESQLSEGDPPWRTTGHEYVGRRVFTTFEHKKSATRTVTIEQVGTVKGWISETDVDKNGEPGFVSERSGKPTNLFEVVFDEERSHPYFSLLLERQDMEQYEVEAGLIPLEETGAEEPANKKQKT
jgi:hypothetical protein